MSPPLCHSRPSFPTGSTLVGHRLRLATHKGRRVVALEVGGRSRRTIDWYRAFLREYVDFAALHTKHSPILGDLSTVVARRWLLAAQSARTRPLSPNSLVVRSIEAKQAFAGRFFKTRSARAGKVIVAIVIASAGMFSTPVSVAGVLVALIDP